MLFRGNRMHGALYMVGYHAEMALKHAYFLVDGFKGADSISKVDLRSAETKAKAYGLTLNPGQWHSLRFWSELLVSHRQAKGIPFPPAFAASLLRHAYRLGTAWHVEMRYERANGRMLNARELIYSAAWIKLHQDVLFR